LRRQVSDLQNLVAQVREQIEQRTARKPPPTDSGEQQALRQQDGELHNELKGLIAELEQELDLEMQSPLTPDTAEQQERQTARDALKRVLADLKQQDGTLEELIGGNGQATVTVQRNVQGSAAVANPGEQLTGRDLLDRQAADMRTQIADLQRQNAALQRQLAERQQELAQSAEELGQRGHDLESARAEADKLRQVVETLRVQPQGEQTSLARPKTEGQQTAVTGSAGPVAPKPTPRPTRPTPPVRQQAQSKPTPQPAQPVPTQQPPQPIPMLPSPTQQLQSARQWLSVGRPDEARRVLAMVQTQMVFVPVTPDQPEALGRNPSATDVGDAIRWLDIGAVGQAMRSITRAIESGARVGG
jgi:hypothetical protein